MATTTAVIALSAGNATAQATKDTLSVDLPGQPATLDPHIQWDTDSCRITNDDAANKLVTKPYRAGFEVPAAMT